MTTPPVVPLCYGFRPKSVPCVRRWSQRHPASDCWSAARAHSSLLASPSRCSSCSKQRLDIADYGMNCGRQGNIDRRRFALRTRWENTAEDIIPTCCCLQTAHEYLRGWLVFDDWRMRSLQRRPAHEAAYLKGQLAGRPCSPGLALYQTADE
jgi:hypothetical protein